MNAKVSIIIPCYNKCAYVSAAIESALGQSHPCEVVVVDDGSTDGSLEVVKRFDSQITWESGPNRGGSAARNRGLDLANGSYIQFLDADDIMPPNKIAVQLAELEDTAADTIAFCPWSYFYDDGRQTTPDARRYWRDHDTGLNLLINMWTWGGFFPPHAWLAPRTLIDAAGHWDESLTGDDDGAFFGRLLAQAGALQFCSDTSVFYRDPPEGSVSRNKSLKSARSSWRAFEQVAEVLLSRQDDRAARRAVLSRVRQTAYAWRNVPEILDKAAEYEKRLATFDISPSLPRGAKWLIGLLGIRRGLAARRSFKD